MWSPTHVQVTVCRIKGLLTKGKNGTNDAFVTISLGKEKFQTSVKQKALSDLEWQEECELAIPTQGNTAEIVLTALHQNFIGVDEFLGMVTLPLSNFDVYERPRTKWYPLKSKPGQEGKNKQRGEIEVRVAFTVKSGSLLDLSKKEKHKGSFGHISQAAHNIGGSLMSLGKEKKGGIKKLASSVGSKLRLPKSGARDEKGDGRLSRHSSGRYSGKYSGGEPDPGVISEDDDEFRFDELSHKSSGSSLNLAGGSSIASGQGSLENLGGGELLRHNSMKRSGSSATLPNRAIQSSSSISSLAVSATTGSSKSPSQQQNDWNQKFFGAKQSKVSETPVGKQPEEKAAVSNTETSPSSLMAGGVPSIIIQDSFIIEEPSLSPSTSPQLNKSNNSAVPVPKARNNKNQEVPLEMDVPVVIPVVIPQPRQRKELATVEEIPVDVKFEPTGEEADAEFDTGLSLSARSRMSPSPSPSFPVNVDDDEHFARMPPVPKPRRSPVPPSDLPKESFIPVPVQQPVPPPRKVMEYVMEEIAPEIAPDLTPHSIQLNPFDSDSDQFSEDEENDEIQNLNGTYDANKPTDVVVLNNISEGDEMMLDEDSVCQMLEMAIEEHDKPPVFQVPPPKPVRMSNVVELYNDDSGDDSGDDFKEKNAPGKTIPTSVPDIFNDQTIPISPVDIFNNQTLEISPVEKVSGLSDPIQNTSQAEKETPLTKPVRRDRLFSLFSTPNSETDNEQQSGGVVHLDWLEDSQDVNDSQGFGGSEQLSSGLMGASGSESAKTMDSAVSITEVPFESSPQDFSPLNNLTEVKNRPLELFLTTTTTDVNFTPPPASALSVSSAHSVLSNKAELLWDSYDMKMLPITPSETGHGRRSIVPEPMVDEDAKSRRKRISLAPCLKTLTLESPSGDQTTGSPITEDDEDDAGEQAVTTPVNETQRMKMAASFHQRVVVGEDKPVNNNTSRDHHRTPRDTSTSEDRLRIYQEKSREGLISLLEDRDNEISDLKDYIDSLLLRVIDTCPTVLQTPVKAKQSSRK